MGRSTTFLDRDEKPSFEFDMEYIDQINMRQLETNGSTGPRYVDLLSSFQSASVPNSPLSPTEFDWAQYQYFQNGRAHELESQLPTWNQANVSHEDDRQNLITHLRMLEQRQRLASQQHDFNFANLRNELAASITSAQAQLKFAPRKKCCSFCFGLHKKMCSKTQKPVKSKDDDGPWSTHSVVSNGKVVCPLLWFAQCSLCGATGDVAHTAKFCPIGRGFCG